MDGSSTDIVTNLGNIVRAIVAIPQAIKSTFFGATSTATTATAGTAGALPSQPAGYIIMNTPTGGTVKVPFYNP